VTEGQTYRQTDGRGATLKAASYMEGHVIMEETILTSSEARIG